MVLAYDLYGSRLSEIAAVKRSIETALGCEFEAHESEFMGEYYTVNLSSEESVSIKWNKDPDENCPVEPEFLDEQILVTVDDTARSEEIKKSLLDIGDFYLLRHEEF